ncbi:hypothetical protein RIT98_00020 [Riemerella anatipestifer]|uniref:Uncharacterized protein n=2 Tax=Riemerella anatipestifer TaxID=34085 RepID=J9R250_RIEAN|nr:hypothetical protein [Riemerella anatipestifer]AFR35874.1 hypothetical protein B739_1276 [Riemerella anatipestifer RA-CH-1]MBT0559923.1 hypothetical protein [Riemerella anatipestifer]MCO7317763.1 hypothetical protein [Riemerella anatipestifer]MCQ4039032.1 hypothetical protein [Riemerella anatipestifer]MDD1538589.1 hypothetical protein [Riemerella anatipestifer]
MLKVENSVNEILLLSNSISDTYFTPGTAHMAIERKQAASGIYYETQITYSIPGTPSIEEMDKFSSYGAICATTHSGRSIVLHNNDVFMNTPLVFNIEGDLKKTIIKTSIQTLKIP